jgi:hypothetical protein
MTEVRLRKLTRMRAVNDGSRSLNGSVMNPELIIALRDWARSTDPGVLIGGLALSYCCKPPLHPGHRFPLSQTRRFTEYRAAADLVE